MTGVKIGFIVIVILLIVAMIRTTDEIRLDLERGRYGLVAIGVIAEVACAAIIVVGFIAMSRV